MLNRRRTSFMAAIGLVTALLMSGCANMNMDEVMILDSDVSFGFGSDQLTPAGQSQIDQYAATLRSRGEVRVEVVGHSDRIGNAKANQALSLRRAQTVRDRLLKERLKPEHVTARGLGSAYPVVTTCQQQNQKELIKCLAPNRRVEIKVTDIRW